MSSTITNNVTQVLKAALDVKMLSQNAQLQQLQQPNLGQQTFGTFLNGQVQGFLSQAYTVEKRVKAYALGDDSIEQVAPLVAEFGLEVEAKTKIVEALANVIKTLTAIQM